MRCFCLAAHNYRRIMNADELRRLRDSRDVSRVASSRAATVPVTPVRSTPPNRLLRDRAVTPPALSTPPAPSTPLAHIAPLLLPHSCAPEAQDNHISLGQELALARPNLSWKEVRPSAIVVPHKMNYHGLRCIQMSSECPAVPVDNRLRHRQILDSAPSTGVCCARTCMPY